MNMARLKDMLAVLSEVTHYDGIYPQFYLSGGQVITGRYTFKGDLLLVDSGSENGDVAVLDPCEIIAVRVLAEGKPRVV